MNKLGVNDTLALIMDATRVLRNNQSINNAHTLSNAIAKGGQLFITKFISLIQNEKPSFWEDNSNSFSQWDYKALFIY